jgi:N-acetyl-gamma-glutamyl-phosphate reductase
MIAEFERPGAPAFRPYALGLAHKHLPEMAHHAGLTDPPTFAPAVANTYRGMIVEVPIARAALDGEPPLDAVEQVLRAAYADAPLVTVARGDVDTVAIEDDAGTDRLTLRLCGNAATGQARLIATLDNLGKGAAGAAVQNLNLMAGLDPLAGLIF